MTSHNNYNNVNEFIIKTNWIQSALTKFIIDYLSVLSEWGICKSFEIYKSLIQRAEKDIQSNFPILRRDELKCVVFGRVSTGKSALINSLLSKSILPSYSGPTTSGFIEIRKSVDGPNYVVFPNSPTERRDISCIDDIDEMVDSSVLKGSHVDLFYSAEECPLLNDNIIIVDTPGIDRDIEMDDAVKRECEDADVVILLVSSESGLGECEKNFLAQYKRDFSHLKVIIVFNKWDMIHPEMESRWRPLQHKYTNEGDSCLYQYLNVRREDCTKGIYFISAGERLKVLHGDDTSVLMGRSERNERFEEFLRHLKLLLSESSASRKRSIMDVIYNILSTLCDGIKDKRIHNSEICSRFGNILKPFNNFQENINSEIIKLFDSAYEEFFMKSLAAVESSDQSENKITESKLKALVTETMVDTLEKIKVMIRGTVCTSGVSYESSIIKLLDVFYFPSFDLTQQIQRWNMAELWATLEEIKGIIKRYNEKSTRATAGWALMIGAGGVAAGIIAPLATVIAVPVLGVVGAVTGGGFGGWLSAEFLKKKELGPQCKKHEDKIKAKWRSMREVITQSFGIFLLELPATADGVMKPSDDKFSAIMEELHALRTLAGAMT